MTDPLLQLFSRFSADRILHEDEAIVVIDKMWGLATHAPEEGRRDDLVSFLKAHYRDLGQDDYIGIHQRLDRETSGVLLFARAKTANRALAEEFEARRAEKTYLAVVAGRVHDEMTLRHRLREGKDGTMIASDADERGARGKGRPGAVAVTHLELVERRGRRSLVKLQLETGRTHQIRAQLAAIGAPIVGDVRYGGLPAARPLLHSHSLSLRHPISGQQVKFEAPVPRDLERGLSSDPTSIELSDLATPLRDAAHRRYGIVRGEPGTDAFRLVNGGGDMMPEVSIDAYGQYAVLSLYREFDPAFVEAVSSALCSLGFTGVYVKHRPKDASRIVDSRRDDIAPKEAIGGTSAPASFEVSEDGLNYEVHMGDGLSTGLFLDQRDNRKRVRELSHGKRVLNLFAYTGSFSVAAAAGGATSTTTVDVSPTVVAWATRNLERAGFSGESHRVIVSDVLEFLDRAQRREESFDLIVLDPPSFSSTKRGTFSAEDDFTSLAARCMMLLAPGGQLLASTNHRGITSDRFRKMLHDAGRESGSTIHKMRSYGPSADFPAEPGAEPHLKSALVSLA